MQYNETRGMDSGYRGNGGGYGGEAQGSRPQGYGGRSEYRGGYDRGGYDQREEDHRAQGMQRGGQRRDTAERPEDSDAVVKVIEVLAQSEEGWDDAARRAVEHASRSVRNIRSLYIKDMQAVVRDGRIAQYRITAKVSFVLDEPQRQDDRAYASRGR